MAALLSVVMPCLNEQETIGVCIRKAQETIKTLGIDAEIVVADNGSTDHSVEISQSLGARVVHETQKGYGSAYRAGIEAACGKYIVIGDSDDSYDFTDMGRFLEPLTKGFDFVIGTRLRGEISKGAMPWLHRYIGNPLLTGLLNLMFHSGISDAHCGMRAFTKQAYRRMNMQTTGMEFASEMVIRAAQLGLKTIEIPITLHRDGRSRPPHLRSFRDGWRHLRFMLLHSPTHLFLWPGFALFFLGLTALIALLPGPISIAHRIVDLHVMVLGSLFAILGFQIINIGIFARIYAVTHGFIPQNEKMTKAFKLFNLERGLAIGAIVFFLGLLTDVYILVRWIDEGFGPLNLVRLALVASTFITIGAQIVFSSFFLSILGIEVRPSNPAIDNS